MWGGWEDGWKIRWVVDVAWEWRVVGPRVSMSMCVYVSMGWDGMGWAEDMDGWMDG